MHSRDVSTFFARLLGAVAVMLAPVALTLGPLGILLGAPLVLAGLILASPGIAALHGLKRPWLRYHLALGAVVGAALALFAADVVATGNADPHDIKALTLRTGTIAAILGGTFGAWSGLIWWAFFGRRRPADRTPAQPQCRVSAAIE